jgi:DNA-binding response OmpR family regulator
LTDAVDLEASLTALCPDLVLLDVPLAHEDGSVTARSIRQAHPTLGLVILSSQDSTRDRIRAYSAGADLFFSKPVDPQELTLALANLQKRMRLTVPKGWSLSLSRGVLQDPRGVEVPLTGNELRFLAPLMRDPGVTVSREDLLMAMGNVPSLDVTHRLESLLSRIRKKVAEATAGGSLPVRARNGEGYVFLGQTEGLP